MLIPHLLDWTDDPGPCVKVNVAWRPVDLYDHSCPMTSERQKTSKGNGNSREVDFFVFFQHSNFIRSKCESLLGTFIASTLDLQVVFAISYLRRPFRTKSALWKPNHQVKAASCWLQFWFEGVIFMGISGYPPPQCHPGSKAWLRGGGGLRFRWHLILTLSKIESQNHGWGCILPQIFLL